MLCAVQGHRCSCVTWQGEQNKAYSSPNQIDREGHQWNLWTEITSFLLGKNIFRPVNPIYVFKQTLFKNSFQVGEKAHPFG